MKFDCVLFDLDGTLINTNELVIKSFQHTLRVQCGRECPPEEFIPYFGEPLITTLERFAPGKGEELMKTYRVFNLEKHDELTKEFPGTRELLSTLRERGITLGVVTSKLKATAIHGLEFCRLKEFFPVVVAYEDTTRHKPEPDPILKALELLCHPREGTLYVGDSTYDIRCAKNAGVKSAAVMWSAHEKENLLRENPEYVLETINDVLGLLKDC